MGVRFGGGGGADEQSGGGAQPLARAQPHGQNTFSSIDLTRQKRLARLERLSIGPAKEISVWQECNDPLLYVERRTFLEGLRAAWSGIETAWVALVKAKQRLADYGKAD